MYNELKEFIQKGYYTIVQCQNILNNLYAQKQLNDDEYKDLFEMSKTLEPNQEHDSEMDLSVINEEIKKINERLDTLEQAMQSGGTDIPEVEEPDGSEFNPITAYKGIILQSQFVLS